jgi:hypothetical protein
MIQIVLIYRVSIRLMKVNLLARDVYELRKVRFQGGF